jgi:hypothetical protein
MGKRTGILLGLIAAVLTISATAFLVTTVPVRQVGPFYTSAATLLLLIRVGLARLFISLQRIKLSPVELLQIIMQSSEL